MWSREVQLDIDEKGEGDSITALSTTISWYVGMEGKAGAFFLLNYVVVFPSINHPFPVCRSRITTAMSCVYETGEHQCMHSQNSETIKRVPSHAITHKVAMGLNQSLAFRHTSKF